MNAETNDPYRVVMDKDVPQWTIEGPGSERVGQTWGDKELTQDICELMNMAFDAGEEHTTLMTSAGAECAPAEPEKQFECALCKRTFPTAKVRNYHQDMCNEYRVSQG